MSSFGTELRVSWTTDEWHSPRHPSMSIQYNAAPTDRPIWVKTHTYIYSIWRDNFFLLVWWFLLSALGLVAVDDDDDDSLMWRCLALVSCFVWPTFPLCSHMNNNRKKKRSMNGFWFLYLLVYFFILLFNFILVWFSF